MEYKDYIRKIILKESGLGFTLIELMIVIAILGTIAGIGIPLYANYIEKARVTRAIAEIRMLEKEILLYSDDDDLPNSLDDIGRAGLKDPWGNPYQYLNFSTLSTGSGGGVGGGGGGGGGGSSKGGGGGGGGGDPGPPDKPRMDRFLVPINSDYDLYSMGRDGRSVAPLTAKMSHDDIVRANDGKYVGLAHKY
jgi:general secretion pathway protein G